MAKKTFLVQILSLFLLSGCTTMQNHRRVYIEESEYINLVQKHTVSEQTYEGLVNTIDVRATFLSHKLRDAQSMKKATNFQWSESELQADKDYNAKAIVSETKIFLSFFTPDAKEDNLHKADSVWRLFLDVAGKRYVGVVQKMSDTPSEVADLYPDHSKWGTPYVVKFSVPTAAVESQPSRLTITGPVGSAAVDFSVQQ